MKALIILAEGFEEIEAVTPVDTLRRAGIEVVTAGVSGRNIKGAHGISVSADIELKDAPDDADVVVLPGGLPGASNLVSEPKVLELIRSQVKGDRWIAAICASPALVLEPAGVLSGKSATCYPGFEKHFGASTRFLSERVVVDGKIITSRGPGTALEFSLKIVEKLIGVQKVEELRSGMISHPVG